MAMSSHAPLNYLQVFNDQFMNMVKDLAKVYPADADFRSFPTAIRGLLLANDKLVVNIFHNTVVGRYRDEIMKRDDAFFLTKSYEEYAQPGSAEAAADIVSKLKGCWHSLNGDNREIIWKYLHLLIALDDKLHA